MTGISGWGAPKKGFVSANCCCGTEYVELVGSKF